jgi:hypothetical protein
MVGPLKKEGDKRKEEIFDYYICFRDAKTRTENLPEITHPRLPPVKDEGEVQIQSLCPFYNTFGGRKDIVGCNIKNV